MKLDFSADGRPIPILEVGDLVRLTRAKAGSAPAAEAGEWGKIRRFSERGGLEIVLAGYSRPRGLALELPKWSNWRNSNDSGFSSRKDRI
jgi:hypothetical protein